MKCNANTGTAQSIGTTVEQPHGYTETRLKAQDSLHLLNMNADIKDVAKNCSQYMDFQLKQPKCKIMPHEILDKPWETVGADLFTLNCNHFHHVVDYHSKFQTVKQVGRLSAKHMIRHCKIIFTKYSLSYNIVSGSGINLFQRHSKSSLGS